MDPGPVEGPGAGQQVVLEGDPARGQQVTTLPDALAGHHITPGPEATIPSMQKAEKVTCWSETQTAGGLGKHKDGGLLNRKALVPSLPGPRSGAHAGAG